MLWSLPVPTASCNLLSSSQPEQWRICRPVARVLGRPEKAAPKVAKGGTMAPAGWVGRRKSSLVAGSMH